MSPSRFSEYFDTRMRFSYEDVVIFDVSRFQVQSLYGSGDNVLKTVDFT